MTSDEKEDKGLVESVQERFFHEEGLIKTFEEFARDRCVILDLDSDEQKHEYMEAYHDFQALFENEVTAFIEEEGATVKEFYRQVREAHEENENSSRALFGQILAAIADYDVFMAMLTDMRAEVDKEAARGEGKGK